MLSWFRKMTEDMKVEHRSMGKMRSVQYISYKSPICCSFSLSIAFTLTLLLFFHLALSL